MRAVVVLRDEIEPSFDAEEIHLLVLENGTGGRAISEKGEMRAMARDKIRAIRRAEKLFERFEEFYNVSGLSIAFDRFEDELIHAVESLGAEVVYFFTSMPLPERLLSENVTLVFPRGGLSFNKALYVHSSSTPNTAWLERAKELFILAIVQPTMPPEASSRKFREEFERMERETEELSSHLKAERAVIRGNIVEDTLRYSEKHGADTIFLNRGLGKENIEKIVERAKASVVVV
ncbi:hypothetical protein [Archaeoglobus fulgidus]|nr:hypothetical protein [Archaeoglobus fulgidus]